MKKIFVVEDDENIRDLLIYALKSAGFEPFGFEEGNAFFVTLEKNAPDIVLLDIMLPGEDGVSILKKLKQSANFCEIPVLMLTAKGSELDRIKGLDLGADDYITKPFSVMEVIARINAVLRRCPATWQADLKIGDVTLSESRRAVFVGNAEILLTYKEFELLHYLMCNKEIVLTRDKILEKVWGFDYNGESRTVDMHIKSLRQKLGESGKIIKTIRNVGYKTGDGD